MKKSFSSIKNLVLFLSVTLAYSQQEENVKDTTQTKVNNLEEVVVTGQFSPQSVKKSVFEVSVITEEKINQQAANNLADVLNQALNINIIPNASTGKSGVQMFGLDAQYFKILVDNIPLVNDEGLGSNTDLTQINLDDIQQIEIVEGSMGVQYGADAVSGIINIITKKSSQYKWEITPYTQEETIGDEYGWFDEGRHIQSVKIGHNLSYKLYGNVLFTRNDFTGFSDNRKGKYHTENDGLRGYVWLPKEQFISKALLNFAPNNNFRSFYKFEYFNETIERYDSNVRPNYNPSTQTTDPTASDEIFSSERFYHHLNFFGRFKNKLNYDISFSYQQQKRNVETYNYRIKSDEKFDVEEFEYESRKVLYSKGTFSNFLDKKNFDFQLGYEINSINGYASSVAGTYGGENIDRELGTYDIFTSSEIHFNNKFSLRPGVRLLMSSNFDTQAAIELSGKYVFNNGFETRLILGSSPRMPNYDELYTYFVDANHDFRGNENLKPEQGISAFWHFKKAFSIGKNDDFKLSNKLTAWFLNVDDRIEVTIVNTQPLQQQYNNIDTYRNWGIALTNSAHYKNLNGSVGISFSGTSKKLDSRDFNDDYLYALQLNANVSYYLLKWDMVFSTFFKANGPVQQFVQKVDENDETILVKGKQDPYSWMDASVRKNFLDKKIQLSLGARNLFDVKRVNTTAIEGGAHSGSPSDLLLGYGRSFFIKLLYNLNI
ncbi:TonB-dependent receptor plug domain-containing protein [Abyssalbus ytuae]|uniref:TonB-dependent receptor plug domain-containing protein n=1 Tax=Abyssalbus ytuae TaxID=2926907 RepID=A0A9E6ZJ05_9FLAO|nr:TonB-dependent receptor plug domain-containing protein [Abyssalbus ytuae]UOB16439.1 TonB-dependent receptor plug domain-containing protein [Abyssalbus ytuae]